MNNGLVDQSRLMPLPVRSYEGWELFEKEWKVVFAVECSEILEQAEMDAVNASADLLAAQYFVSVNDALVEYLKSQRPGGSARWTSFEGNVQRAAQSHFEGRAHVPAVFDRPGGFRPMFRVTDGDGIGLLTLAQMRFGEGQRLDWINIKMDGLHSIGHGANSEFALENTLRIVRKSLQAHFPEGPHKAEEARHQHQKEEQAKYSENAPSPDLRAYRWAVFEDDVRDTIAQAKNAGLEVEYFAPDSLKFEGGEKLEKPAFPAASPLKLTP